MAPFVQKTCSQTEILFRRSFSSRAVMGPHSGALGAQACPLRGQNIRFSTPDSCPKELSSSPSQPASGQLPLVDFLEAEAKRDLGFTAAPGTPTIRTTRFVTEGTTAAGDEMDFRGDAAAAGQPQQRGGQQCLAGFGFDKMMCSLHREGQIRIIAITYCLRGPWKLWVPF